MHLIDTGELPGELVVLLDAAHRPIGTAPKATVHTTRTPLHLAFSAYLFDTAGSLLITRRAVTKKTFPGVWTNSACGHPAPGEDPADAVRRRVRAELALEVGELDCVLPDFRYEAADARGIVENEVCPVFAGTVGHDLDPDPGEVEEWEWIEWPDMVTAASAAPQLLSPWSAMQVVRLAAAGFLPPISPPPVGLPPVSSLPPVSP